MIAVSILFQGLSFFYYPVHWQAFYAFTIVFRFLQGVGSGVVVITGFSILVYLKPKKLEFTLGINLIFLWVGVLIGIFTTNNLYSIDKMTSVFIGYFGIFLFLLIFNICVFSKFRK